MTSCFMKASVHVVPQCPKMKDVAIVLLPKRSLPHVKLSDIVKMVKTTELKKMTIVHHDEVLQPCIDDVLFTTSLFSYEYGIIDVDIDVSD